MDSGQNIAVYIRVRDNSEGKRVLTTNAGSGELKLHTPKEDRVFTFDFVGGEDTAQEAVFDAVGRPLTEECLNGYNATVFAYGQTGSGKTHTMFGPPSTEPDDEERGLTPRVLDHIFALMAREERLSDGEVTYRCVGSLLEIYKETITDLLDASRTATPTPTGGAAAAAAASSAASDAATTSSGGLKLREDATRGVYVEGICQEELRKPDEALQLLAHGISQRHVGSTAMNAQSSRSHLVFSLVIEAVDTSNSMRRVRTSQFNLVDLAGSERQKDTQAAGQRLKEACSINKSLSALGNLIHALTTRGDAAASKRGGGHIPYRDSKLTHLLKDSLGGNAKTCVIANVSPNER